MVGTGIRTHKAHGHIGVTGALDLPAGKHSRAVGINQKHQSMAGGYCSLRVPR
jgi:hypothetical protein